ALTPHLVPRHELPAAIAAGSVQFNLARLLGPSIAGVLIVRYGIVAAFIVNAFTFIPMILALWSLPTGKSREPAQVGTEPLLHDWSSGLRLVWNHRGMRRLSLMIGAYMFFSAPATGLLA